MIPGLGLPSHRLHHLLPEPVHRLEQHRVQRPEELTVLLVGQDTEKFIEVKEDV